MDTDFLFYICGDLCLSVYHFFQKKIPTSSQVSSDKVRPAVQPGGR